MNVKKHILTIVWAIIVACLVTICVLKYMTLSYNLHSVYDEGFFYVTSVFAHQPIADTQPLTLAQDAINTLVPNIEQYDVLALRQYGFWAKCISLIFLIGCSCLLIYHRYKEKKLHIYLALIASYLLFGTVLLPGDLFNMNDVILILVTIAFSLCLLSSIASQWLKHIVVSLIGIVSMFTLLCNLPAGCMMIALCGLFIILDDGYSHKKLLFTSLFGLLGLTIGLCLTHLFVISLQDCFEFLQKGIVQTTNGGRASHHSLSKVILVIFFGIRDLTITTLLLCGITYICRICQQRFNKDWLTILLSIIGFVIIYQWQVKPKMTIACVLCWFTIMFLEYHLKNKALNTKELLLILFSFVMPIGVVFGTNTSIISKALACGTPWGLLIFYLCYKSRPEVHKYAVCGFIVIACCILNSVNFSLLINKQEKLHFEAERPIARMNLSHNQKAFYEEVHTILSKYGYKGKQDTLLGFCFNEMTVVAMDAIPYTNDQQPEEFLLHDLENLPYPKYMILSEWDSIVLYDRLLELNWDFPVAYDYYKLENNPDPNSGYNMTQSMIYCRKQCN